MLCSNFSHVFGSRTHSHDHMASERLLCLSSVYGISAEVVVDVSAFFPVIKAFKARFRRGLEHVCVLRCQYGLRP